MAAGIHAIFSQGQGVPVSSAHAERVVEMKLWLAAIVNGQLQIVDTAVPTPVKVPIKAGKEGKEGNGTPPNKD